MSFAMLLRGPIGRASYAFASVVAFFSQHLLAILVLLGFQTPFSPPWWFWFNPLRLLAFNGALPDWIMWPLLVVWFIANGLLVALALRRAQTIGADGGFSSLALAPGLQLLVMLWLSLAPENVAPGEGATSTQLSGKPTARDAVIGLLTGILLCVAAVAVSTLLLRLYGYGLFVASPFVIGLTTAYIVNRKGDRGDSDSLMLVLRALFLGALALIGFAFEGAVCLVMASPLIVVMGLFGGLIGRRLAIGIRHRRALVSVAILPLVLAGEVVLPPRASFESVESVVVDAPPSAVWDSIVHMGPIPDAPAAPFRWGLAYPMRGQIFGSGVGAIRQGVFSTGVAYERVTEWEPDRKLSFVVLSDPPTMHELSPYAHVHAPHVIGYFKTLDARFTIQPLANGRTRLSLATRHELDLEPALYWIPFAEWAVHANKVRVLGHFRQQAEVEAHGEISR